MTSLTVDGLAELTASLDQLVDQLNAGLGEDTQAEAADQVLGYMHPAGAFTRAETTPLGFAIGIGGPYFPGREAFLERPLTAAEQDVLDVYADRLEQLLATLKGA